jgi:7-keto-8-aminopelargonate synthetase-like enzyme
LIFSASLPPAVTASVLSALSIIERRPSLREKISWNTNYLYKNLQQLGFNVGNPSPSAIIPVVIGDNISAFKMWRALFNEGVFTTPVISPAVPKNRALIRISTMASHRKSHLDKILRAFKNAGENLGIVDGKKKILSIENNWKENIMKWISPISKINSW